MISFQQCKHVITYYIQKLMSVEQIQISPHVQRDCVFLNKRRGEICANIAANDKLGSIIFLLHKAERIHQINSVPENNRCFIDKKSIPKSNSGIQLIVYSNNQMKHICIQKKYQNVCYAYFKIRHFPHFIEQHIKEWLLSPDWFLPRAYTAKTITDRILNSQLPQAIYTHLIQSVDVLTSHSE